MSSERRLLSLRSASRQPPIRPLPVVQEPSDDPMSLRITSVEREVSRVDRRVERLKCDRIAHLDRLIDERVGIRLDQEFRAVQRHNKGMMEAGGLFLLTVCAMVLVYMGAVKVIDSGR